ncbi:MAG: histidine--tRNA ligase [Candidatus Krumholzibacteria bacterium]|nr:histidine--tRNA ligase [Candidatus Krumholzibacteria bacterium]
MRFKKPRGTQDLFGDRMRSWAKVEEMLAALAGGYGYSEIRTPVFEVSDLFVRAVGEGTDIVSKEMYAFADKKGRSLTLRPENTAPVMRAFLENGLHRSGGITKFWYQGPMFRYDRPQAGRYRQFHQFGAEAIGHPGPAVDAEIIDLSLAIYRMFGFTNLEVRLNSVGCPVCRPGFLNILRNALGSMKSELCGTCSERAITNPMRIFDCKECVDIKNRLPVITDHLCDECSEHFEGLQSILRGMKVDFMLDSLLVRGLDYYTKTAYEVLHPGLGGQNALCGGGRYDGLAEECGGGKIPAVGFSAGMERLMENLPEEFAGKIGLDPVDAFFILPDESVSAEVLRIAGELRSAALRVSVDLSGRSMKKQMKVASESGAPLAVIIGPEEIEKKEAAVKVLASGGQESVPFAGLSARIFQERKNEVD